jgi:hypothetical protein
MKHPLGLDDPCVRFPLVAEIRYQAASAVWAGHLNTEEMALLRDYAIDDIRHAHTANMARHNQLCTDVEAPIGLFSN